MTVRWSSEAAADFAAIVEYIRKQILQQPIESPIKSTVALPPSRRFRNKDVWAGQRALVSLYFLLFVYCRVPSDGRSGGDRESVAWVPAVALIARALREVFSQSALAVSPWISSLFVHL